MKNDEVLLSIKNLKQYFNAGKKNEVRAIENISFDIYLSLIHISEPTRH
ncbi:hypothetical protein JMUB7554_27910 [Staphylococcus aureus]